MHVLSGKATQMDGPNVEVSQRYLLAVEDIFQGLRNCVTSVSAMVLLLQIGRRTNDLPLELGLTAAAGEVRELLDKALTIDRQFSRWPAHQSLLASCLLLQGAASELRTALRAHPELRTEKVLAVLATIHRAYGSLQAFAASTPWDPTTISSSCACASN